MIKSRKKSWTKVALARIPIQQGLPIVSTRRSVPCRSVSCRSVPCRNALTLVELFVVLVVVAILLSLFLPFNGRNVREAARRATCMNNIRQIALATHNYENQHGHFPRAFGPINSTATHPGAERLSGFALLLPFMDHDLMWREISEPSSFSGVAFPAGPDPWATNYRPWQETMPGFLCPTRSGRENGFGHTSYAFSVGDVAQGIQSRTKARGPFGGSFKITFSQITDGCSNTIALAEIGNTRNRETIGNFAINQPEVLENPASCLELTTEKSSNYLDKVKLGSPRRGERWADGSPGCGIVNTILPPNSPSASAGGHGSDGIYSAGAQHPSVIIVALMDGSGHTINVNIDAGDSSHRTLTPEEMDARESTPFGVWGQLGTANGGEIISIGDL